MVLLTRSLQIRFSWKNFGVRPMLKNGPKIYPKSSKTTVLDAMLFMIISAKFEKQKFRIKKTSLNANN